MTSKKDLRFYLYDVLKHISPERHRQAADALLQHLAEDEYFLSSARVMLYASMETEVATEGVLEKWSAEKEFFLPKLMDGEIKVCPFEGKLQMKAGQFGILEPTSAPIVDLSSLDYVLVPGVGFDSHRNRLGHGKAYYDCLFQQAQMRDVRRVGIAFQEQIVPEIPVEKHDIQLHDLIIV